MSGTVDRTMVDGVPVPTGHLIDGRRVAAGAPIPVHSPIDGELLGHVPDGGPAEVAAAIEAGRRAFPAWADLGPDGRCTVLHHFADAISDHAAALSAVETADNGALPMVAEHVFVPRSAQGIRSYADWACELNREVLAGPVVDNHIRYEPAGVAALIVPWNAPLMLGAGKVAAALAAGDTVVLKPPEWAPLSLSLLGEIAVDAGVPAGVFNIVHGYGETAGAALSAHPGVDRLSFTGSPEAARLITAASAPNLTPLSFELGGKSPFVVLDDADLDLAAGLAVAQFANAGQACVAGTRLLVHEAVAEEFMERVLAKLPTMKVGDPRTAGTMVGPLIHPDHAARVKGFVDRALANGARPLAGGGAHPQGPLYFEPTILTDVKPDAEIVQAEVFGPVLTFQTFGNDAELIELANATQYGLAASIFTADEPRALRLAAQTIAGTVWVNCFYERDLEAPFGGARTSGVGREGGRWSFDFFAEIKNVAVRRGSFSS
ncbi:MAG TPA: aldehyde dehydrogenase family protein [Acidimicrobiia bacterium]|nr:aldehyde dehydrogenase family protein [Acidimicrobiia bacterium]